MYDDDRYENMEKYGDLWQYSVTARNEFCLVCLAIMLEQEAALYYRDQLAQSLNKPNNSFSSSLVDTFSDVNTDIVRILLLPCVFCSFSPLGFLLL